MSQAKRAAGPGAEGSIPESAVAEYLRDHPDFFENHAPLLLRLRLPHETNGSSVSLVERQVSLLRQRNTQLERQLKELVSVAKSNDSLVQKIHRLSVRLMTVDDLSSRLDQVETSLREDFAAERAALVLFNSTAHTGPLRSGFVKVLDRDDPLLKPFAAFLRAAHARCGPLRDRQAEVLFDREAESVASAAMLPLGQSAGLGFLVIGSKDPAHFNPGKSMDFLERIGELVSVALGGEQKQRASA